MINQYLHFASLVFSYGSLIAGSLLLLVAVAFVVLWSLVQLHGALPSARGVELALAIRLHGSRYRETVFWKALKERASRSEFAAREIIRVVGTCVPKEEEEEAA